MTGRWAAAVRYYLPRGIVFIATFYAVVWLSGAIVSSNAFWSLLAPRLAQDERFQLNGIFLPDRARDIPVLIIGDALFHRAVPDNLRQIAGAESIIVNGYDPDDLSIIMKSLGSGMALSETRICTLVVQVSPLFSARALGFGTPQHPGLLQALDPPPLSNAQGAPRLLFHALRMWISSENTPPDLASEPGRLPQLVGQGLLPDPSGENWKRAFAGIDEFPAQILLVLDPRGTDWGDRGALVLTSRERLDLLADANDHVTWRSLDEGVDLSAQGCPAT